MPRLLLRRGLHLHLLLLRRGGMLLLLLRWRGLLLLMRAGLLHVPLLRKWRRLLLLKGKRWLQLLPLPLPLLRRTGLLDLLTRRLQLLILLQFLRRKGLLLPKGGMLLLLLQWRRLQPLPLPLPLLLDSIRAPEALWQEAVGGGRQRRGGGRRGRRPPLSNRGCSLGQQRQGLAELLLHGGPDSHPDCLNRLLLAAARQGDVERPRRQPRSTVGRHARGQLLLLLLLLLLGRLRGQGVEGVDVLQGRKA